MQGVEVNVVLWADGNFKYAPLRATKRVPQSESGKILTEEAGMKPVVTMAIFGARGALPQVLEGPVPAAIHTRARSMLVSAEKISLAPEQG